MRVLKKGYKVKCRKTLRMNPRTEQMIWEEIEIIHNSLSWNVSYSMEGK